VEETGVDNLLLTDQIVSRFERALRDGRPVSLEGVLRDAPADLAGPESSRFLFQELLTAELEFHRQRGDKPEVANYGSRFPEFQDAIRGAFANLADLSRHDEPETQIFAPHETESIPADGRASGGRLADPGVAKHSDFPKEFGRYKLVRLLGRGGMGSVYLAHDSQLDRRVAIKFPEFGADTLHAQKAIERFYREARSMATVEHPNICPIYDVGEYDGVQFLSMAYLDGETLAQRLRRGDSLPPHLAAATVATLANALQSAHDAGIVHRDLKPSNIMLRHRSPHAPCADANGSRSEPAALGEPIVMDFGLASRAGPQDVELTGSTDVVGSPAYMAPEQVRGEREAIGPQTDVYALGVILYELLCGRRPFEGKGLAVLGEITSGKPPSPPSMWANVDKPLGAICLKAMAPGIDDRFQSAAEAADALKPFCDATSVAARRHASAHRTRQIHAWWMIAGLLILPIAAIVAAIWLRHEDRSVAKVESRNVTPSRPSESLELPSSLDDLPSLSDTAVIRSDLPLVKIFKGAGGAVTALAFIGDRQTLLSGHRDGAVHIWDVESSVVIHSITGLQPIASAAVSPDHQYAAIGTTDRGIRIHRLDGAVETDIVSDGQRHVIGLDWSPDGRWLLAADYSGTTIVWDVEQNVEFKRLHEENGRVDTVAFSRDGQIAIVASKDSGLSIWDVPQWKLRREIPDTYQVAAISPAGTRAVAGTKVFDLGTDSLNPSYETDGQYPTDLRFTQDGRHFVACRFDRMKIRNVENGVTVGGFEAHCAIANLAALSLDGKYVVTAGGESYDPHTKRLHESGDFWLRMWRLPESVRAAPSGSSPADTSHLLPPRPVPSKRSTGEFYDSGQKLGGDDSQDPAAGDLDGDGDLDVVVANREGPNHVWLNDGAGRFEKHQELDGEETLDVALGDLDGDGDLDAAFASKSPSHPGTIWLNNGDGRFTDTGWKLEGEEPSKIAFADVDRDADLDAVVANGRGPNRVFRNNGSGQLLDSGQRLGNGQRPGGKASLDVGIGDLDGDGDLDIFSCNYFDQPNRVWLNDGRGGFSDSGQTLGAAKSRGVALADVDHDGDLDAYVENIDGPDALWINDGSGTFSRATPFSHALGTGAIDTADLDGNGQTDFFIVNGVRGGPEPGQVLLAEDDGEGFHTHWSQPQTASGVALADFDGDGDIDAFITNVRHHPNRVWFNRDIDQPVDSPWSSRFRDTGQQLGNSSSKAVELGDLDGDGDLDALIANDGSDPNRVWRNDGHGHFSDSGQSLGTDSLRDLALGDLDDDDDLDVFLACEDGPNTVWMNDGQGGFTVTKQQIGQSSSAQIALADLDGDGDLDAWVGNLNPHHDRVWINDGAGRFTDSGQLLGQERNWAVHTGDVDGDGDVDVLVGTAIDDPNSLWLNDGTGVFTKSDEALSGTAGSNGFHVGDLNGDGAIDLFETYCSGSDRVWLNDGAGRFTETGQELPSFLSKRAQLADLDGDGDLDVVVSGERGMPNYALLNDGTGQFDDRVQWFGNSSSSGLALGDLDGDGDLDVFVANYYEQPNRVWLNESLTDSRAD